MRLFELISKTHRISREIFLISLKNIDKKIRAKRKVVSYSGEGRLHALGTTAGRGIDNYFTSL